MIYVLRSYYRPKGKSKPVGMLKIGYTSDDRKDKRVQSYYSLNPGVEFLYFIPGLNRDDERNLHIYFSKYKFSDPLFQNPSPSKEWFIENQDIINFFDLPEKDVVENVVKLRGKYKKVHEIRNDFSLLIRRVLRKYRTTAITNSEISKVNIEIRELFDYEMTEETVIKYLKLKLGEKYVEEQERMWKYLEECEEYKDIFRELESCPTYSTESQIKVLWKYRNMPWIFDFLNLLSGQYKEAKDLTLTIGFIEDRTSLFLSKVRLFAWRLGNDKKFWDKIHTLVNVGSVLDKKDIGNLIKKIKNFSGSKFTENSLSTNMHVPTFLSNFFKLELLQSGSIKIIGKKEFKLSNIVLKLEDIK